MHVAMIIDNERLVQEHAMLRRLSIALIDEGAQLTRIVPDEIAVERVRASERRLALANRLEVPMKVLPWMRGARTANLVAALERSPPEVIYAIGRETWPIAGEMAVPLDCPVALDVWAAELAQHAPRGRGARHIGGYIAPTEPLAAALRRRVEPHLVSLVPMGVAVPSTGSRILQQPQSSIALAIIGSGRDLEAYRVMLTGLNRVIRDMPQVEVVMELRGPHGHDIWREIDRFGLRSRISAIQDAALHRPLLTRCDVLVMPERYGEVSSLLLECMAVGMAVVAREDPWLDMLIDGETAVVVSKESVEAWAKSLRRCLAEPEYAATLGRQARELVADRHRSSQQVIRLLDTFSKIVGGETYPFSP